MTRPGRPPSWLLDPAEPSPVAQDVARFDGQGRMVIPVRVRAGVKWLPGNVLGVLEQPGRARLLPWAEWSPPVLTRRKSFLLQVRDSAPAARAEDLELLRALDDRYCKLNVGEDGRVRLHEALRLHLSPGLKAVFVVRFPKEIEIWSPEHRTYRNQLISAELDGLP